jgi:hypothetical protein
VISQSAETVARYTVPGTRRLGRDGGRPRCRPRTGGRRPRAGRWRPTPTPPSTPIRTASLGPNRSKRDMPGASLATGAAWQSPGLIRDRQGRALPGYRSCSITATRISIPSTRVSECAIRSNQRGSTTRRLRATSNGLIASVRLPNPPGWQQSARVGTRPRMTRRAGGSLSRGKQRLAVSASARSFRKPPVASTARPPAVHRHRLRPTTRTDRGLSLIARPGSAVRVVGW